MMYRVLGPLPRKCALFSASLFVFVATGLVVLFVDRFPWWGSPMASVDWAMGTNVLVGPVAAGVASMLYSRMAITGWIFLLRGTRRGVAATLAPALVIALAAVVSLLVFLVLVMWVARSAGTTGAFRSLWIVGPTGAELVAEVMFGAAIGAWLGRWWLAPIAGVVVYVIQAAGAYGSFPAVLVTGPASTLLVELVFNPGFAAWQSLAVISLAAVCAGSLAIAARSQPSWPSRGLIAGGAVGVVAGCLVIGSLGSDARYQSDVVGLVCSGDVPRVCLSSDSVRPLASLSREFDKQSAVLIKDGLDVPDRFVQLLERSVTEFAHDGVIDLSTSAGDAASTVSASAVSWSLAYPAPCKQFFTISAPTDVLEERILLADWIARQTYPAAGLELGTPREKRWMKTSADQQLTWVRSTYTALVDCDLTSIRLPW
jgi:hypothetical protein